MVATTIKLAKQLVHRTASANFLMQSYMSTLLVRAATCVHRCSPTPLPLSASLSERSHYSCMFLHLSEEREMLTCALLCDAFILFFSFFLGGRLLQGYIHCFTDATRNIGKGWFVHRAHVAYMSFLGGVLLPLAHTPRSLSSVQATASVRTLGGVLRSHVHT